MPSGACNHIMRAPTSAATATSTPPPDARWRGQIDKVVTLQGQIDSTVKLRGQIDPTDTDDGEV